MKNVLLTGCNKGIGFAIKRELELSGYQVFGAARTEDDQNNYLSIDLSVTSNAKKLYQKARDFLGNIDILINNAGQFFYSSVEEIDKDSAEKLINLNFITPCLLCSYVAKDMKKNNFGRIINIGSISGVVGEAYASVYSATKAGLGGLTKSLALELAQYNITVKQINPGWVETNLTNNALDKEERSQILDVIPQRRFIEPIEVAKLCKYLISDDAKGLTGQLINLCAGLSCGA